MNIICETGQGANYFIMKSYVTAFASIGCNVVYWDKNSRSVYDIFYETEKQYGLVDIFFGHTWNLTKGLVRNLLNRPYVKIILRADHFGELDDIIDRQIYPVGIADDNQKTLVKELCQYPNFKYVTSQYSQSEMERSRTHNRWEEEFGLTAKGILLCADLSDYHLTERNDQFKADIVFCGGYWPYKARYLSWLHSLSYPNINLKTIIFGNGWSGVGSVGNATEETIRKFYASSLVCPALYEPHSIEAYSDISQRPYQIAACGGFQISQRAIGIEEIFTEDEIVIADDKKDFLEKTIHYIQHPDDRLPFMKKSCLRVYKEHTNLHRAAYVLSLLDCQEESKKCLELANQYYSDIKNRLGTNDIS